MTMPKHGAATDANQQEIVDDKTIRPRDGTMFSIARTSFEAGFKRARATDMPLEQAMTEFESLIEVYVRALEGQK